MKAQHPALSLDSVYHVLSTWTGIPVTHFQAQDDLRAALDALPGRLRERIVGQEEAIDATVKALRRTLLLKSSLRERRPLGVQLFVGPSGVGKTETARLIAELFYGDAERFLLRIDMSEFSEEHTMARLVGAPPGYAGYGRGGQLVNALKREQHGVLLLDEVEKAHLKVLTEALLPLIGEGIVHDMNAGQQINAQNYLIILTSNLGANRHLEDSYDAWSAASEEDAEARIMRTVRARLPHEFLGRIDRVTVFKPLDADAVSAIWHLRLREFEEQLMAQYGAASVTVDPGAEHLLLERARQEVPAHGARAVATTLKQTIVDRTLDLLGRQGREPAAAHVDVSLTEKGDVRFALRREQPNAERY